MCVGTDRLQPVWVVSRDFLPLLRSLEVPAQTECCSTSLVSHPVKLRTGVTPLARDFPIPPSSLPGQQVSHAISVNPQPLSPGNHALKPYPATLQHPLAPRQLPSAPRRAHRGLSILGGSGGLLPAPAHPCSWHLPFPGALPAGAEGLQERRARSWANSGYPGPAFCGRRCPGVQGVRLCRQQVPCLPKGGERAPEVRTSQSPIAILPITFP